MALLTSQKRLSTIVRHLQRQNVSAESDYVANYRAKLKECKKMIWDMIDRVNCNPIIVRLAWHDCGTYDRTITRWPDCGGANASIRFKQELKHAANAGLSKALNFLKPMKDKFPELSWADIIQLASVTAIEHAGGPVIPIRFGRLDTETESQCPKEGNLPGAEPPFPDGSPDAAVHLRRVFYRMGFNDREIVALSGAHTLGRAFAERSGTVKEGYGGKKGTQFTQDPHRARNDRKAGLGMNGGKSWTKHWLTFDNEYFHYDDESQATKEELLQLSTDRVLGVDSRFRKYAEAYRENQSLFFEDYVKAHAKLSELGSKFRPSQGFYL